MRNKPVLKKYLITIISFTNLIVRCFPQRQRILTHLLSGVASSLFIASLIPDAHAANYATIFSENFDSVAAPQLPSGWSAFYTRTPSMDPYYCSSDRNTSKPAWYTQTSVVDSTPNAIYAEEPDCPSTNTLMSPLIYISSTAAKLTFRHRFNLESAYGYYFYDAGVLGISIDNAPCQDIRTAGGVFTINGPSRRILDDNPLAGRYGWSGNSSGFITTGVSLPAAAQGKSVRLCWVLGTDTGNAYAPSNGGWRIDLVSISEPDSTPPVFSNIPQDITQYVTTGTGGAIVNYILPTAVDAVDGTRPVTCSPAPDSNFLVGNTTVTCIATDLSGNSMTSTFLVSVIYHFSGFFQPIDNFPTVNMAKAGQAIPIKFSLMGDQGLSIIPADILSPGSKAFTCGNETFDSIEETVPAGNSTLTYDPVTDQYTYAWKTDKNWRGCRRLVLMLNDGIEHIADFNFTR